MNLIVVTLFIGNLTLTSYRSVPSQTDSSPFHTSTGERVSISGAAISQDLLCGACRKLHKRCQYPTVGSKLHYGDVLYVEHVGFRVINDCMGLYNTRRVKVGNTTKKVFSKQNKWLDIWVSTYEDERNFHRKYGITQHKVWLVRKK